MYIHTLHIELSYCHTNPYLDVHPAKSEVHISAIFCLSPWRLEEPAEAEKAADAEEREKQSETPGMEGGVTDNYIYIYICIILGFSQQTWDSKQEKFRIDANLGCVCQQKRNPVLNPVQ